MNDDQLHALGLRIEKGTEWLVVNDPGSRFHLWFQAGLTPASPRGLHDDVTWVAWKVYYDARLLWERLMSILETEEKRRLPAQLGPTRWKPANKVRGHP